MKKVKVVFRKNKDGEAIAFFPEFHVQYGNIMSYMHIGQHGEASLDFYYSTKKANQQEYETLLNELKVVYDDCILTVKQKLRYKDLLTAWNYEKLLNLKNIGNAEYKA